MVADVRPISRTSPSTCQKIKYSNRSDTLGSCPTSDHRWSATQARLLAPHTVRDADHQRWSSTTPLKIRYSPSRPNTAIMIFRWRRQSHSLALSR